MDRTRIRWMRAACSALILLCLLRIWHMLLLKQGLDEPAVLAGWLAAAFGLVLLVRHVKASPQPAHLPDRTWTHLERADLVLVGFFFLLVFLFHWGFERAASDGREYFVQVRSLVIDRDLDFANENAVFGVRGTAAICPFGAALLWAPFFVACHLWLALLNLLGGAHALDGFGNPYQRAVGIGTLVYGCAGLALIYRVLLDYFHRRIAVIAVLALCCGSFLIWYLTVENSMVHGVSMFSTTVFLYAWHRTREHMTTARWGLLGAAAGLMALVRWQNVAFLVAPIAYTAVRSWWQPADPGRKDRALSLARDIAAFAIAACLVFVPQLIFWKVTRGAWMSPPTSEHGFSLAALHLGDVLYSSNHGLFSLTPLLYFATVGLLLFTRRDRPLAAVLIVGFLAQVVVNGAVDIWWGGAGFGARRFDNCSLAFALGLASLIDWCRTRPLAAPVGIVAVLVFVNAVVMLDVRNHKLPAAEGITFSDIAASVYRRTGNPFSFPLNAIVAWNYDAGLPLYDELRGRTYNNVAIAFGDPADARFLGLGWADPEGAQGTSFRWSAGPVSTVVVPLKERDAYRMDIECAPFLFPGSPTQTVQIVVNGIQVDRIELQRDIRGYGISLPVDVVKAGLNLIAFRYGYVRSPAEVGVSIDPRPLAVRFNALRLTRLLGG